MKQRIRPAVAQSRCQANLKKKKLTQEEPSHPPVAGIQRDAARTATSLIFLLFLFYSSTARGVYFTAAILAVESVLRSVSSAYGNQKEMPIG